MPKATRAQYQTRGQPPLTARPHVEALLRPHVASFDSMLDEVLPILPETVRGKWAAPTGATAATAVHFHLQSLRVSGATHQAGGVDGPSDLRMTPHFCVRYVTYRMPIRRRRPASSGATAPGSEATFTPRHKGEEFFSPRHPARRRHRVREGCCTPGCAVHLGCGGICLSAAPLWPAPRNRPNNAPQREAGTTYAGRIAGRLGVSVGGTTRSIELPLGEFPVMVQSRLCALRGLSPAELVARGECVHPFSLVPPPPLTRDWVC